MAQKANPQVGLHEGGLEKEAMKRINSDWVKLTALAIQTPGIDGTVGIPVLVWGPVGVGKTARIASIARRLNKNLTCITGNDSDPTDFKMPMADLERQVSTSLPPEFWFNLSKMDNGMLFLDELSCSPPAVQAVMLKGIHERTFGGLQSKQTPIVAAANPADVAAGGWEPAQPVLNRFLHLNAGDGDGREHASYLRKVAMTAVGAASEEASDELLEIPVLDTTAWAREFAELCDVAAAFEEANPIIFRADGRKNLGDEPAFPTYRSMEFGLRAAAAGLAVGSVEAAQDLLAAAVGGGVASEFFTYRRNLDLPRPDDVLDGKVSWSPDPARVDRTRIVLNGVARAGIVRRKTDEIKKVYGVLARATATPDVLLAAFGAVRVFETGEKMQIDTPDKDRVQKALKPFAKALVG